MPYNGSGTYTPPAADFPAVTQTVISSSKFNNILNDVAAALTNAVTRDGQSPMTAALPMGGWPINAVALGTAAAPSINFSGASTTGFFAAIGVLGFSISGVEGMRLDANGNLGIGTASPAAKLESAGTSNGATLELLRLNNIGSGANTQAQINFIAANTSYGTITGGFGPAAPQMTFNLPNATAGNFVWQITSTERMRLDASGNVGIGTTSPGYRLDVVDAGGNLFRFTRSTDQLGAFISSGTCFFGGISNSPLAFVTNNIERMRLDSSGNLLIATTSSPAYTSKLRLQGGLEVHSSQQLNIVPGNTSPYEIVNRSNGGFDFYPTGTTLAFRIASAGNVTISAPSSGTALAINSVNTTTPYINYVTGGTTTVGAAGGASALPATPVGYVTIAVAGTSYKMPYYNT